jgi:alcohol dehydrogenase class IV
MLPHAVAFNSEAAPEAMRIVAEALGVKSAAQGLYDLAVAIGAPVALKDIGMPADGLERAAELATQNPYANPRPVEYAGVLELLRKAFAGKRP